MFSLTKKLAVWIATAMIVVGLAVPHICLADTTPTASEHVIMVKKADVDQHSKTSKADHCCVSHHCCTGKVAPQSFVVWSVPSVSKASLSYAVSENVTGHIPQGLKRPPKAII